MDQSDVRGRCPSGMAVRDGIGQLGMGHDMFGRDARIGKYSVLCNIGSGSSSRVLLCKDSESGMRVAMKIITRGEISNTGEAERLKKREERVFREVIISSLLRHPHIARLFDFFYDETHFFLAFEYIGGQQLFDVITRAGPMSEDDARRVFRQILSAIDYVHRNSIVHRDLKIENILLDENGNVKLVDFGLANFYDNKRLLNTFCGSLYFAAPELLNGQSYCGPEVDVWSLGVVLYVLLCGVVPFDNKDIGSLQAQIRSARFVLPSSISEDAQSLIRSMIVAQPSSRAGLEQIIYDRWVNKGYLTHVNNYMNKRYPIKTLDSDAVAVIESVANFQFPGVLADLQRYMDVCKRSGGMLEQTYWAHRPAISLYYLLTEATTGLYSPGANKSYVKEVNKCISFANSCGDAAMQERVLNFVKYQRIRTCGNLQCVKFVGNVFMESRDGTTRNRLGRGGRKKKTQILKKRRSILQGILFGTNVHSPKDWDGFVEAVVRGLEGMDIKLEIGRRNIFCSACGGAFEKPCYFKVSLFYNVIIGTFVFSIRLLHGCPSTFTDIKGRIWGNLAIYGCSP